MIDNDASQRGGIYDSKADALKAQDKAAADARLVALWLEAIDLASTEEKDWRKRADMTVASFKDEKERTEKKFNILFANVETIVPAVYSSIPVPDVRRRFNDQDPVARVVSQVLERALTFSLDAYDFDATLRSAVIDNELVGRAVTRVRYVPYFTPGSPDPSTKAEGEAPETPDEESAEHTDAPSSIEQGETVSDEEVVCEHVPWANFRRGPARMWSEVPWIAFELFLTREQLTQLSDTLGPKVELDCAIDGYDKAKSEGPPPDVFMRGRVWEVWDREKKQVLFIATGYKTAPIRVQDDPLGLRDFFPIPRPLYAIEAPDTLVPIEPYRFYKDQAEELDRVTRRIGKLIQVLKWRGFYPGSAEAAGPMTQLADADDGELIPVSDMQSWVAAAGGDLSKAFWMMPVDVLSKVITELYEQRNQILEVIRQITGIADIMRGETNANETLGAQQIKTQWGSLRIQRRQAAIQRYARDIFRIKAELIAEKFSPDTIMRMTGVKLLPQPQLDMLKQQIAAAQQQQQPVPPDALEQSSQPSLEAVMQVLRSDMSRTYRVDIESDSTIRGDLTRFQENMTQFLTGTGAYLQAVGPMVQEGVMPKELAVKLFIPYTRQFKLGKEIEDTLETFADLAEKESQQPKPPSAEDKKLQYQQQSDQQKMNMEGQKAQLQAVIEDKKMQLEQTKAQAEQAKQAADIQLEREKMQAEYALKREIAMYELQMKQEQANAELALTRETKQAEMQANREMQAEKLRSDHEVKMKGLDSSHQLGAAKIASDGVLSARKMQQKDAADGADDGEEAPDAFDKMAAAITKLADAVVQSNKELQAAISRPRTVKTPSGRTYTST